MKKRTGKRGMSPILFEETIQVVIAVASFLILLSYVSSQASSAGFEANFFSKELGLLMSTANAVPQNLDFLYHISSKTGIDFDVSIGNNRVWIGIENETFKKTFWYFTNAKLSQEAYSNENKSGLIDFTKQGDKIIIKDVPYDSSRLALSCPPVNTNDDQWKTKKFIIDPAHGGTESKDLAKRDPGDINNDDPEFYESKHTFYIANALSAKLKNDILTRKEKEFMPMSKRIALIKSNRDAKALISINIGSEVSQIAGVPVKDNYITAYYSPGNLKSQRLGCIILNHLLLNKDFPINGAAVVPLEDDMLSSAQTAVILEFGNIEMPKDKNFIVNSAKIADSIYAGLGEYYS